MNEYPEAQKLLKKRAKKLLKENARKMEKSTAKVEAEEIIKTPHDTPKMVRTVIQVMNPESQTAQKLTTVKKPPSTSSSAQHLTVPVPVPKVPREHALAQSNLAFDLSDEETQIKPSITTESYDDDDFLVDNDDEIIVIERTEQSLPQTQNNDKDEEDDIMNDDDEDSDNSLEEEFIDADPFVEDDLSFEQEFFNSIMNELRAQEIIGKDETSEQQDESTVQADNVTTTQKEKTKSGADCSAPQDEVSAPQTKNTMPEDKSSAQLTHDSLLLDDIAALEEMIAPQGEKGIVRDGNTARQDENDVVQDGNTTQGDENGKEQEGNTTPQDEKTVSGDKTTTPQEDKTAPSNNTVAQNARHSRGKATPEGLSKTSKEKKRTKMPARKVGPEKKSKHPEVTVKTVGTKDTEPNQERDNKDGDSQQKHEDSIQQWNEPMDKETRPSTKTDDEHPDSRELKGGREESREWEGPRTPTKTNVDEDFKASVVTTVTEATVQVSNTEPMSPQQKEEGQDGREEGGRDLSTPPVGHMITVGLGGVSGQELTTLLPINRRQRKMSTITHPHLSTDPIPPITLNHPHPTPITPIEACGKGDNLLGGVGAPHTHQVTCAVEVHQEHARSSPTNIVTSGMSEALTETTTAVKTLEMSASSRNSPVSTTTSALSPTPDLGHVDETVV